MGNQQRANLLAVVDNDEGLTKEVATAFDVLKVLADHSALSEDGEMAVDSDATRDHFRAEQTIELLGLGHRGT